MKDLSLVVVYLAFLALPGIVGKIVYKQLVRRVSKQGWEDLAEILLFTLLSYSVYWTILYFTCTQPTVKAFQTLQRVTDPNAVFAWPEILASCAIAVVLAYLAAFVGNYKILNKIGRRIRATNRYGDEDVWEFFHNMKKEYHWAFVKDHKLNLLYFGDMETSAPFQNRRKIGSCSWRMLTSMRFVQEGGCSGAT